jgi:hypothetical protein
MKKEGGVTVATGCTRWGTVCKGKGVWALGGPGLRTIATALLTAFRGGSDGGSGSGQLEIQIEDSY